MIEIEEGIKKYPEKEKRQAKRQRRDLAFGLSEIYRMGAALELSPRITKYAAELYRRSLERQVNKGIYREVVVAAILYAVCRQNRVPRTLGEVVEISKVPKKDFRRVYKRLVKKLDLKLQPISSIEFIPRFCLKLGLDGLDGKVGSKATEILQEVTMKKGLLSGRSPAAMAAAAIYIAAILCGEHKTQQEVSSATGVSGVTIGKRYREFTKVLGV